MALAAAFVVKVAAFSYCLRGHLQKRLQDCNSDAISVPNFGKNHSLFNPILTNTHLNDLIGTSKCGNFMIFLSLRFYVKSIFGESRSCKTVIFRQIRGLDTYLLICSTSAFKKCKNS